MLFCFLHLSFQRTIADFIIPIKSNLVDFYLGFRIDVKAKFDAIGQCRVTVLNDFYLGIEESFFQVILFNISFGGVEYIITYHSTTNVYLIS